ncbi:MAG: AAA family ATPase [Tissierellales bacterium]|nr:AAA family ATPase [Tissierellales bacterium]
MPMGIIVFGLNGSGKSTLGKALARLLGYKHMDVEDYAFTESDIPYKNQLTREEYVSLMLKDIKKYDEFVLSAVKGNFGEEISSLYELGVFIDVPYDIRVKRVEQRSIAKFGDRVKKGGDMYESEKRFFEFVKSRDIVSVKHWSESLNCPIIEVDGTKDILENAESIKEEYLKIYTDP